MRRKITVYGLRFSKTSFWNRLNTGFPDPAVATVLTACGIETLINDSGPWLCLISCCNSTYRLRYWNGVANIFNTSRNSACCNSTYRLRYWNPTTYNNLPNLLLACCNSTYRLRYWNTQTADWLPLLITKLQQYLPLAVLKHVVINAIENIADNCVATVLTACGIETFLIEQYRRGAVFINKLQQCLPLTVLKLFHPLYES